MTNIIGYRIYTVGFDGHFVRSTEIECGSDDETVQIVQKRVETHALELWCGGSLIRRFEPED